MSRKLNTLINKILLRKPEDDDDDDGALGELKPEGYAQNFHEQTDEMEWRRRAEEQAGHRNFGVVNQREKGHREDNTHGFRLKQHPRLKSPRFSGDDARVNALPTASPEANERAQEQRLEQQHRKQLQAQNELKSNPRQTHHTTPKPGR